MRGATTELWRINSLRICTSLIALAVVLRSTSGLRALLVCLALSFAIGSAEANEILLNCHGKWVDIRSKLEKPHVENIAIALNGAWIKRESLVRSDKSDWLAWRFQETPNELGMFDEYHLDPQHLTLNVFGREKSDDKVELRSVRIMACAPIQNPFRSQK